MLNNSLYLLLKFNRHAVFLCLVFALTSACNTISEEKEKTDLQTSVAVAYGKITSPYGEIAEDAAVRFNIINLDSCKTGLPEKSNVWMARSDRSDNNGSYKIMGKYLHVSEETVCVVMEVYPPEELSGFDTTYVWGDSVTFRHESLTPPIDSVNIDIVLDELE
jgi:hypothetical protein